VIGLDCITGLQTARILAKRGVPVLAVAKDPQHYCCRTRMCKRIYRADTSGEAFIALLERLGPTLTEKAVLFPCTDMSVLLLARWRKRLEPWYHVDLPELEVVETLMDKGRFYELARRHGLPVPATFILRNRGDAERAAAELTFPCVLKPPMKTPQWERQTSEKVLQARSPEELLEIYDRCIEWSDVLTVQQWIPGDDSNLYSCNCYLDAASQPLATFVARKLRQWPPKTGTSSLGEECRNDVVLNTTIRLFQSVGYRGLGYVEMKRDARTGQHYIIEPNVGRPTGRSAIAEAGGVELIYTKYCDNVGWPLPENRLQRYRGVKWIHFRRDLQSAWHDWRNGDLTLRNWWKSWSGKKEYAVFAWRDLVPFFAELRYAAGKFVGRWRSKPAEKPACDDSPAGARKGTSVHETAGAVD